MDSLGTHSSFAFIPTATVQVCVHGNQALCGGSTSTNECGEYNDKSYTVKRKFHLDYPFVI